MGVAIQRNEAAMLFFSFPKDLNQAKLDQAFGE
jgi:hypothetical protein